VKLRANGNGLLKIGKNLESVLALCSGFLRSAVEAAITDLPAGNPPFQYRLLFARSNVEAQRKSERMQIFVPIAQRVFFYKFPA
jgi:hypothetical protein